jgi:hypothetical protein
MNVSSDHLFAFLRDIQGFPDTGLKELDPEVLMNRIRGIHKALSVEHEFADETSSSSRMEAR